MKKWYALLLMTSFVYAKQDCCLLGQIRSILANLQSQISGQFVINNTVINETFTIVENIESIVDSLAGCATIAITAPATITEPGSYCLENNSTDLITISSDNVSLNLNNHSLGSVNIGAFNNVTVFNGFVQGGPGITLFGSTNVELAHLQMNATTANGITIGNASSAVAIHDVTISNAVGTAIDLAGGSFNITIKDVLISGGGITSQGIAFAAAPGARDVFIESTAVYNCTAYGFHVADGTSMINCAAAYNGGNGIRIQAAQSAALTDSSTYVQDCVVMNNSSDGVHIINGRVTLVNVVAIGNGANVSSSDRRGFYVTSSATVMFEGCVAESNGTQGFLIDDNPASTGTVRGCSAINNGSFGFSDPGATLIYINNIASNNNGGGADYNPTNTTPPLLVPPFYPRLYNATASYWNNVATVL